MRVEGGKGGRDQGKEKREEMLIPVSLAGLKLTVFPKRNSPFLIFGIQRAL